MPLTTIAPFADVKALLRLALTQYSDYPALQILEQRIIAVFSAHLGRDLSRAVRTETHHVARVPASFFPLRALPILSISSITLTEALSSSPLVLDTSLYQIMPYGIRISGVTSNSTLTVVYDGGYEDATIPGDLIKAAVLQIVHEYNRLPHVGATEVTSDGGTIRYPELGLLEEVRRLLAPYRHPRRLSV